MDGEICTSISGYEENPRELMFTLAYLTGQGWKASVLGRSEKEGDRKRAGVLPVLSSPIRLANSALHPPLVPPPLRRCRLPTGFRFKLISPYGRHPLPPWVGDRDQEHCPEVVSRRHTEAKTGAGRTAGMCLFQ